MFVIINCNNFPIKYLLQAANPNFKYSLQAILSPNIFLGGKLRPATCIGSSAATCFPFRLYSSFVIWSLVFSFSFCIIKQCCTWQGTLHQIPDSSPPKKACFSQQLLLFNSSPIQMLFMIKHSIYMYFFYLHKTSCLVLNHYKHLCVRIRTWTPHLNSKRHPLSELQRLQASNVQTKILECIQNLTFCAKDAQEIAVINH